MFQSRSSCWMQKHCMKRHSNRKARERNAFWIDGMLFLYTRNNRTRTGDFMISDGLWLERNFLSKWKENESHLFCKSCRCHPIAVSVCLFNGKQNRLFKLCLGHHRYVCSLGTSMTKIEPTYVIYECFWIFSFGYISKKSFKSDDFFTSN